MDLQTLFNDVLPDRLAAHPHIADQVDAVLQVEINGDGGGIWVIDLTREHAPPSMSAGPHPAPTVQIHIDRADFAALMSGDQRWTDAFIQGRIKIEGDLVTAIKLRKLFADLA
jgi:putative sterol carrier protein